MAALTARKTPLVISPHFHPQASNKLLGTIKPFYDRVVDRYTLEKANKVICVSKTEADMIRRRFAITDKVVTIYNGVDADEIRSAKPYDFDGKLVLYVGRLERYKNIHRVVEAFAHLPKRFAFYIIGEGPYKSRLEALVHHRGLSERVKLLGACPDAQLYRCMRTSALLVNLSEIEAFGITVLESIAAGTPALVNDKLGLRELARHFDGAVFSIRAERSALASWPKRLRMSLECTSGLLISTIFGGGGSRPEPYAYTKKPTIHESSLKDCWRSGTCLRRHNDVVF